jgi:hypothetical protein
MHFQIFLIFSKVANNKINSHIRHSLRNDNLLRQSKWIWCVTFLIPLASCSPLQMCIFYAFSNAHKRKLHIKDINLLNMCSLSYIHKNILIFFRHNLLYSFCRACHAIVRKRTRLKPHHFRFLPQKKLKTKIRREKSWAYQLECV